MSMMKTSSLWVLLLAMLLPGLIGLAVGFLLASTAIQLGAGVALAASVITGFLARFCFTREELFYVQLGLFSTMGIRLLALLGMWLALRASETQFQREALLSLLGVLLVSLFMEVFVLALPALRQKETAGG